MPILNNRMRSIVAWTAYPVVIILALSLYQLLLNNTPYSSKIIAYIPVVFGAAIITFLESYFPYRDEWTPEISDVGNDLTFMVFIQIVLPKLLSFLFASTLLSYLQTKEIFLKGFWPHQFPSFIQAILMLFLADLLRYWLHRAAHEWEPLWRLHAVHHSPHKLYWVNVGRFHPLDKALQFLLDAFPFIIVGVSEEVLSIYFVFYAINGFFQHCNINLRLGFLNYLISGPELHRWHHSILIRESNRNYGNNLIVWDLLFGTWFLPKEKSVDGLGLKNRQYPLDFASQIRTPFIKGLDKQQG